MNEKVELRWPQISITMASKLFHEKIVNSYNIYEDKFLTLQKRENIR